MLLHCGLVDFLTRRVQELFRVHHQLIVVQPFRDIVVVLVEIVPAVAGEFLPQRVSEIIFEVQRRPDRVDLICQYRLHAVFQQTALVVEGAGDRHDFRFPYGELRFDGRHLVPIGDIHVLIQVVFGADPARRVRRSLLNQDIQSRLTGVTECRQPFLAVFLKLVGEVRKREFKQRGNIRRIVRRLIDHAVDLLLNVFLQIRSYDDRERSRDRCILRVAVAGDAQLASPLLERTDGRDGALHNRHLIASAYQTLRHADHRAGRHVRRACLQIRHRDGGERHTCQLRRLLFRVRRADLRARHELALQEHLQIDGVEVFVHHGGVSGDRRRDLREILPVVLIFPNHSVVVRSQIHRRLIRRLRQIVFVQRVIIRQPVLQRLRHVAFHLVRDVPDILAPVRVAGHHRRRHQIVSRLQTEAVLYRVRVGAVGDLLRQVLSGDEHGGILSVSVKRLVAAVVADRHVLSALSADRTVVFQIVNADGPVDAARRFLFAVEQEKTSDLLRHLHIAVVNRLSVKAECPLDVPDTLVNMLDAVVRRLVQQPVDERTLRFRRVVEHRRFIVVPVDVRLRVYLDAVDVDLTKLRFSEGPCRDGFHHGRGVRRIYLQFIPSVELTAVCQLEVRNLPPEGLVDFAVFIQTGIFVNRKGEFRSADQRFRKLNFADRQLPNHLPGFGCQNQMGEKRDAGRVKRYLYCHSSHLIMYLSESDGTSCTACRARTP